MNKKEINNLLKTRAYILGEIAYQETMVNQDVGWIMEQKAELRKIEVIIKELPIK